MPYSQTGVIEGPKIGYPGIAGLPYAALFILPPVYKKVYKTLGAVGAAAIGCYMASGRKRSPGRINYLHVRAHAHSVGY